MEGGRYNGGGGGGGGGVGRYSVTWRWRVGGRGGVQVCGYTFSSHQLTFVFHMEPL